ncbi:hypothetical protein BH09VER1_BH09VER1_34230 [soil metagenome]
MRLALLALFLLFTGCHPTSGPLIVKTWHPESTDATGGTSPILLYAPGWNGSSTENAFLFQNLAHQGFTVLSLGLPRPAPLPPLDFQNSAKLQSFHHTASQQLTSQSDAVLHLLDTLQADPRFKGRPIGIFGFSFGGAVAAEACRRDPRLKAGANLDGTLFGEAARAGAPQPFLFLTDFEPMPTDSALHSPDEPTRLAAEFSATGLRDMNHWLQTRGGVLVQFPDVQHQNFCDEGLRLHGGKETLTQIAACLTAFFDETLKGEKSPSWPPVTIHRFP